MYYTVCFATKLIMSSGEIESDPTKDIDLTLQDVVTIIQRSTSVSTSNDKIEVLDYELNAYSKDALGMLNSYWALKVDFKKTLYGDIESKTFFVKCMSNRNPEQLDYIEPIYFTKECGFFKQIAPALLESYKSEKWGPSCYLSKENVLVMDDLGSLGYRTANTFFNDLAVLKIILATIARFHSSSILLQCKFAQSLQPTALNEYYPDELQDIMFTGSGAGPRWFWNNLKLVKSLGEKYGYDPVKLQSAFEKIPDLVKPSKTHHNVICHGDLWTNNFMLNHQSSEVKCLLVDFQIVRYAPLVLDILHLLHLHSSSDLRNQHESDLIQHYHKTLTDTIQSHDCIEKLKIPTLNDIFVAYRDLKLFGAVQACLYTLLGSTVYVECPKVPDGHAKFFKGDVLDIIATFMQKDVRFKARVEDVVNELGSLSQRLPN